jgi:arsenate reductase
MAEGLLRHDAGDRFDVESAGTRPGQLRPEAITVMRELGIDISAHRSKSVDEFAGRHFDFVLTVCDNARESCPILPGNGKVLHRSFEDPVALEGTEADRLVLFRRVRDELRAWLRSFQANTVRIVPAGSREHLDVVRTLFQEYWDSFGFTPCFQGFDQEAANLPGRYAPPGGRLGLAWVDGEPAGCVALRRIDAQRCEAKRLYVRPQFRGCGLGKQLLDWITAEARAAGYLEMMGDTMPVMTQALEMYARAGFERTGPYMEDPTPGAVYLRLKL